MRVDRNPPIAFSGEVYNGSREENTSEHEIRASDSIRTERALDRLIGEWDDRVVR
jgi:hypothetical protein